LYTHALRKVHHLVSGPWGPRSSSNPELTG
jgi:hypothetical protein